MNSMKRQKELRSIWFQILLISLPTMVEQTRVIITVGQWVQYSYRCRNSYFRKSYFMSRPRNRMCKLNINCLDQEENKHCRNGKTPRATVPCVNLQEITSLKARFPSLRVGQSSFQLCVWMEAHSFIKKPILGRESKQLRVFGPVAIQHFLFE